MCPSWQLFLPNGDLKSLENIKIGQQHENFSFGFSQCKVWETDEHHELIIVQIRGY
jgi:hypothetical protein